VRIKIKNQKSKIKNGFTLVELLASVIVLVAVGSVIAGVTAFSLRGANKTNTIENIRQNGNYALNQISKNIEFATVFNGLSTDGSTYVTSCPYSSPTPPALPVPFVSKYEYIKITPFNGNPIEYQCISPPTMPATFTANGESIFNTDPNNANSVTLESCSIACTKTNATDVPIIGISFTLGPKISNGNEMAENNNNSSITFKTSVTMRNYKE